MEHCSEPDDARDREGENDDDDESEEDKEPTSQGKKRKVVSRNKMSPMATRPLDPHTSIAQRTSMPLNGFEYALGDDDDGTVASSASSRKPSVTMQEEERVVIKASKSARKDPRRSSIPDIPERYFMLRSNYHSTDGQA